MSFKEFLKIPNKYSFFLMLNSFSKGCSQWTDITGENIGWVYKISACFIPALQTWHHCVESIRRCHHHSCCSYRGPSHKRGGPGEKEHNQYSAIQCLLASQYIPQERNSAPPPTPDWYSCQSELLVGLLLFVYRHSACNWFPTGLFAVWHKVESVKKHGEKQN